MAKGETDYEIRELKKGSQTVELINVPDLALIGKVLAVCDTQANVVLKLARMKFPKNGLAIIPVERKK